VVSEKSIEKDKAYLKSIVEANELLLTDQFMQQNPIMFAKISKLNREYADKLCKKQQTTEKRGIYGHD